MSQSLKIHVSTEMASVHSSTTSKRHSIHRDIVFAARIGINNGRAAFVSVCGWLAELCFPGYSGLATQKPGFGVVS